MHDWRPVVECTATYTTALDHVHSVPEEYQCVGVEARETHSSSTRVSPGILFRGEMPGLVCIRKNTLVRPIMKTWKISRNISKATRIKVDTAIIIWLTVNLSVAFIPIWI